MNEDMKRVLEELEQDLLEDDLLSDMPQKLTDNQKTEKAGEEDIDAILAQILAESDELIGENQPAFEDPDKLEITKEPVNYRNYSNQYGNNAPKQKHSARKQAKEEAESEDKWLIALMGVASALCLGIIGVLVYWMNLIP